VKIEDIDAPPPKRVRAKLHFVAVGTQGQRDAVRKTVRLRVRRIPLSAMAR
jgi:hypothetical protein